MSRINLKGIFREISKAFPAELFWDFMWDFPKKSLENIGRNYWKNFWRNLWMAVKQFFKGFWSDTYIEKFLKRFWKIFLNEPLRFFGEISNSFSEFFIDSFLMNSKGILRGFLPETCERIPGGIFRKICKWNFRGITERIHEKNLTNILHIWEWKENHSKWLFPHT